MKLKKGDSIIVLRGKDKGRKGTIDKVLVKTSQILVTGINVVKKHVKSREGQKGGIIEVIRPLNPSKVALVCPKCAKPTRIGYQIAKDGTKHRLCHHCQELI